MSTPLIATYFDGRSAKAWPAELSADNNQWLITISASSTGPKFLRLYANEVKLEEISKNLPRRLTLPDGATIEVADQLGFEALLPLVNAQRSMIDQAQNSWKLAFGFLGLFFALVVAAYYWILPATANIVAQNLPPALERTLGDQAWPSIEREMFSESKLSSEQQAQLQAGFERLRQADTSLPNAQLLFRASKVGPNAVAIPGGRVVMTDELYELANKTTPNDKDHEALLGVLAHELGHLKHRHSLRSIIQAAAVTGVISLWLGDISTIVTAIPTLILQMKYSRDFETESDQFAVELMDKAGINRGPTADLFEAMMKLGDAKGMFSSHPPTEERAKLFRDGNVTRKTL